MSRVRDILRARSSERQAKVVDAKARAAVAAILRPSHSGPEVLFIQRAEHPGDPWSGHMAFPGGRREEHDATLESTAVRETVEEIGLHLPSHGERLVVLDDVPTHTTGLVVRPFVWWLETAPESLTLNHEVAAVTWVDLASMMEGQRDTTFDLQWKGQAHQFPGFSVSDRVVWGLTYRMLHHLFEMIRD